MIIQENHKGIASIDVFKFLCAVMVVGIHTQPFGDRLSSGLYATTIFRVAVPFFFAISSYLFYIKGELNIIKYVRRLVILDIVWTLLELPFIIYIFFGRDISLDESVWKLLQGLLFGESYKGSWYIHASWMGMFLLYVMSKYFSKGIVAFICVCCFTLGLLDSSYRYLLNMPPLNELSLFWIQMSNILQPSESFIIAIPYMAIGKYLAEHKNVVNAKYIYVGILASIIFLLLEAKLCSYFFAPVINVIVNPRLEVFVCLVPFVIFVIPALLKIKIKSDSPQTHLIFLVY